MDAGREPFLPLGPELTGEDDSVGGDGVSGGVCHWGGVSDGVTLATGATFFDNFLLSLAESLCLDPPKLDINERTRERPMTSERDVRDKNLSSLFEYYPSLSLTVKRVESKEKDWSVVGFKRKLSEVGRIALNERLSNSDCAWTEFERDQSIKSTHKVKEE